MTNVQWEWCCRKYSHNDADGKLNAGIGYYFIKNEGNGKVLGFRRALCSGQMSQSCYKVQSPNILDMLDKQLEQKLGYEQN